LKKIIADTVIAYYNKPTKYNRAQIPLINDSRSEASPIRDITTGALGGKKTSASNLLNMSLASKGTISGDKLPGTKGAKAAAE
jgi:hypothetical protein